MADNEKRYLDLQGLTLYDENIKKYIDKGDEDSSKAAGIAAAKAYVDAQSYTDEKIAALKLSETYALKATEAVAQNAKDTAESALEALNGTEKVVVRPATQEEVDDFNILTRDATTEEAAALGIEAGDQVVDAIVKEAGVVDRVEALESALGEDGSVAEQINDAIEALNLDETYAALDDVNGIKEYLDLYESEKSEGSLSADIKEIAIDALAEALIPEEAKESLDTLEEIAAWIQAHPDDVATINKNIQDLQGDVEKIENAIGEKAAAEVSHEATEEEVAEGKAENVGDKIVDEEAKDASGIYKDIADLDKATDARLDALEVALGMKDPDGDDGEENKTVTEKITDIEERLDDLEAVKYVAITDAEINALFDFAEEEPVEEENPSEEPTE